MPKPRNLTSAEMVSLDKDIIRRLELQREMAANTYAVLELELSISESTIQNIERNEHLSENPYKIAPAVQDEVRRRRKAWRLSNECMRDYLMGAICKRYRISSMTLYRRTWLIKAELRQVQTEFREAA